MKLPEIVPVPVAEIVPFLSEDNPVVDVHTYCLEPAVRGVRYSKLCEESLSHQRVTGRFERL